MKFTCPFLNIIIFAITLSLKPKVKLESEVNLPKGEGQKIKHCWEDMGIKSKRKVFKLIKFAYKSKKR